jgi:hypothetical protein
MKIPNSIPLIGLFAAAAFLSRSVQGESEAPSWPTESTEILEAFVAHQNDVAKLRDLMAETSFQIVWNFSDKYLRPSPMYDGQNPETALKNSEEWLRLMAKSNLRYVAHDFDIFSFVVKTRGSAVDTFEKITYYYDHPLPAKACVSHFREVSCGICDVYRLDRWSIRYEWSTGQHEADYSQDLDKWVSQTMSPEEEDAANLRIIESRTECTRSGLEKMGYENPEVYY